ncbi:serine/threonine-protein kinase [Actinoplanes sp. OR16]|uniref:serine/threonine protein kinase n=1 Tax=Actinoplanes sp. OR16 TaxID=946334 RepID=UPI000FD6D5A5|nr:serine/threonine-protein kinase [Actinoplanes sp. OR16]
MSMPLRPGDLARLGRYDIVGRLGEGGMGSVFLGRGPDGRPVAIKTVRPEYVADTEFRARFRSEVNRAQQVPPFSTAEVIDADPDHEPPYLVVEYVDGPSLAAEVRDRGRLTGSALHSVAVGVATALTAIHGAGVIHRDLKPGNVLFARGGIKVIDFGIARAFEATSQHTRTDQMVGTVAYMAPERFDPVDGRPVTPAADIFAWGAVVVYAATGRTPFAAESAAATAMRILTQAPDLTGVPDSLVDVVERALAKDPVERPTARELLDLLLASSAPGGGSSPVVPAAASVAVPAADAVSGSVHYSDAAVPVRSKRRSWIALSAALGVLIATGVGAAVRFLPVQSAGDDAGAQPTAPASAPSAPAAGPEPVTPEERLAAILRGNRQTLIHVSEIDRDLALESSSTEVVVGDGTGQRSLFALESLGVDYLIRSMYDPAEDRCVGVKIIPDVGSQLVPAECTATKATLFELVRSEQTDDQGRPTYWIYNDSYGYVQWSDDDKSLFVDEVGDNPPASSFSFVDRGPLPS